jgi:hypothetical protein
MKRVLLTKRGILSIFVIMALIIVDGYVHKYCGKFDRDIDITYALEALIMPPDNTFSTAASRQLISWIGMKETDIKRSKKIFIFGTRKSSISGALRRLERCKTKLLASQDMMR